MYLFSHSHPSHSVSLFLSIPSIKVWHSHNQSPFIHLKDTTSLWLHYSSHVFPPPTVRHRRCRHTLRDCITITVQGWGTEGGGGWVCCSGCYWVGRFPVIRYHDLRGRGYHWELRAPDLNHFAHKKWNWAALKVEQRAVLLLNHLWHHTALPHRLECAWWEGSNQANLVCMDFWW